MYLDMLGGVASWQKLVGALEACKLTYFLRYLQLTTYLYCAKKIPGRMLTSKISLAPVSHIHNSSFKSTTTTTTQP